ncbi:ABC transporter ATP-binding protein [Ruania alba]|uniref:Glutathione transport system ATP-binding protein n=1 Tax=Ruania alba TaxID=648782 RepID=A0A1H5NHR4_9MICO|nr:ABC transporter ATP-binding protein [Ruania alba]SEF00401.1 glutathione transport system ATP-binding protein [Ruania alba]
MDTPTPTATDDLLVVEDLSVRIDTSRGPIDPVQHVNLRIPRGGSLGLVGESGSGKSVTAMSITRLLPRRNVHLTSGRILLEGRDLSTLSERQLRGVRGGQVATIFQEPMTALNPVFTIGNQMAEPLRRHMGMGRRAARDRSRELLDMVGIRESARVLDSYPHQLSGGMRQRAMIAMAMSCEPALLIADEPTTALDVTTQLQILDLILDLQADHGTAVLLITHDLGVVAQTCDEVAVMYDGRIQETAGVADLFARPQAEYTKRLLSFMPEGRGRVADALHLDEPTPVDEPAPPAEQPGDDPQDADNGAPALLQVRDLVKTFPGRRVGGRRSEPVHAVRGVSFTVPRGNTVAIVGESGSGKSTTGRALLRLHEPTSGSVTFDGQDLLGLDDAAMRQMRARMQIVFQDTYASLDPRWLIGKTLAEPLRLHTEMTAAQIEERIAEVLTLVGLEPAHADRFPHEFSGGQRQRIGIARALLLDPDLVVCDEPVSALDVSVQAQVLDLMKDLQDRLGLTYVFISHDLSVVEMMADHVVVMSHGQVVEQGSTEQIFTAARHPYTRALLAAVPVTDPSQRHNRSQRREIVERGIAAAGDGQAA